MGSLPQRRGRSLAGVPFRDADDGLDLFSRRRNSIPIASSVHSEEMIRLDRILTGSGRGGRGGMDELLDADAGKNDYDWLLTPPGTPLFPSSDASEHSVPSTTPKKNPAVRSVSNARASRLSAAQSENGHDARTARSNSTTRPSISSTYSNYFTNNNRTSLLNTSSASVTSRPTTPGNRPSSSQSSTRPTTPGNRPSSSQSSTRLAIPSNRPSSSQSITRPSLSTSRSRPSTPAKTRPTPSPPADKPRPPTNSRPSTPTSRPQTPSTSNSARTVPRPSTPTHRAPAPPISRSPSASRTPPANGRNPGPSSRPNSPGPRPRAPVRPTDLPDFPTDTPPNLRTKLPERPPSAGRARPGGATLSARPNSSCEAAVPASSNRRQSLPIVSRSKVAENPPKARLHSNTNSHVASSPGMQKTGVSELGSRRPSKPAAVTESNGFGRTISKKSIDMALRHMDIRQSMGGARGASLFPQSIRSAPTKGRPARLSDPMAHITCDVALHEKGDRDGTTSIVSDCDGSVHGNTENIAARSPEREWLVTRGGEVDIYGSTRYESMLLKEDSKNMNWLHSVEDKSDESSVFDHRFEPLPELFSLP